MAFAVFFVDGFGVDSPAPTQDAGASEVAKMQRREIIRIVRKPRFFYANGQ